MLMIFLQMEQFDSYNGNIEELSQPDRFTYEVSSVIRSYDFTNPRCHYVPL